MNPTETPFAFYSATANRFALLDGLVQTLPDDLSAVARELARGEELELDGLLVVEPPQEGGHGRMTVFNRDGSRAEACGNGLRCVAKHMLESGHATGDHLLIETVAGMRQISVERSGSEVVAARAELGAPHIVELDATVAVGASPYTLHHLELGNPHAVLFVRHIHTAPVEELGPRLERNVLFPHGANVTFAAPAPDGLEVRTWERGVGETSSCGTGSAAAAVAAIRTGRCTSPTRVQTRGGSLEVEWDGELALWLTGEVQRLLVPTAAQPGE